MKFLVLVIPLIFAVAVHGRVTTLLSFGGSEYVVNHFTSGFSCSGKLLSISEDTVFARNDTCNGFRNGTQDINFLITNPDSISSVIHILRAQVMEAYINGNVVRHLFGTIIQGNCTGGTIKRTEVLLAPNQELCSTTGRSQANSVFSQIEITGPCASVCTGNVTMTSTIPITSTIL